MTRNLDLRHVASPAVRGLIELANLTDFDRIREQITRLGGCSAPVNLVGSTQTLDTANDYAIVRAYTTADEPTGRLLTACGNRRSSRCPACSRVYAADTFHLVRAGLSGGKNVADSVRTHPRLFVTLTAPSFGPVHNRPTNGGKHHNCRCGKSHSEDAAILGTPLNPRTYDYAGAVLWNAHAGALWTRFTTYLRRELAAYLGITQKALNSSVRVSFAKVAEYQKRGLVHFHAVARLDGPDGHTSTPPPFATAEALTEAVYRARARVVLTLNSDAVGDRVIRWGAKVDVRPITSLGGGELTDQRVASYVAKYATKSAEGTGTVDRSLICTPCSGRGWVGGRIRDLCPNCEGTGRAEPFTDLRVQTHVRTMIRTAWTLGGMPEFAHLKLAKWAHMLGFRGHFSTKSRAYSTTLGALRDVRRSWRIAQAEAARERAGHAPPDDASTLVTESSWTFIATGYRPGEDLLAAQTRHETAQARAIKERAKTEGEVWQ